MMDSLLLYKILKNRTGAEISASGNPATLPGTLKNNLMNEMKVYGWSKQERTTGAQLFDASRFDGIEQYGVSLTVEDGVIYAEGTPTQNAWITAKLTADEIKKVFKNGKITIKSEKVDNCNFTVGLYFEFIPTSFAADGSSIELTLPENIADGCIYYYVNLIKDTEMIGGCKIMLYQYGDGTYEPYTGGQPSPSPDYPQEIVSAGMKWSTGVNLFDISQAEIGKSTSWGATAGTEIMVDNSKIECLTIIDALPSTTYTVENFTPGKIWLSRIIEANEDGLGYVNHKHYSNLEQALIQKTITTSANTTKLYISMQTIDGANISADTLKDVQIMIVQGDVIGDYEPYDGGVPKLYGDKVNLEVHGKNLFNLDYASDINNWKSGDYRYIPYYVGKGNKVSVSYSEKLPLGSGFYAAIGLNKGNVQQIYGWLYYSGADIGKTQFTFTAKEDYIYLNVVGNNIVQSIKELKKLQIEVSSAPTTYEPYHTPQSLSIQTPTGLPAIPVTSGGNYTDASGQQWIADYIDLKRGKYVQNVRTITIDEKTRLWHQKGLTTPTVEEGYYTVTCGADGILGKELLVDKFRCSKAHWTNEIRYCQKEVYAFARSNDNAIVFVLPEERFANKAEFAEYLAEHPLTVMTYLDPPIERNLTQEEIQAYKALKTYNGTTIVENDAECYMEVSAGGGDSLRAKKLALILGD